MPQPGSGNGQSFISKPLTNVAVAFDQKQDNYAWRVAAPMIETMQDAFKWPEFNKGDMSRIVVAPRGPLEELKTGGFKVTWKEEKTGLWGVASDLDQNTRNNQEPPFKSRERKAKWCVTQMNMKLEQDFSLKYLASSSSWTTKLQGSATPSGSQLLQWNNPGSTPLKDAERIKEAVFLAGGGVGEPNICVMQRKVWSALKNHPEIIDRIKFTTQESIQLETVARYFEVDRIVVSRAVTNSAGEGLTDSIGYIAAPSVLFAYVNPERAFSEDVPSALATAWWTGMEGSIRGLQITEEPIPLKAGVRIGIQAGFKMIQPSVDLGGLLYDAVATS